MTRTNDDDEFNSMLRDFPTLSPEQRELFVRQVIGRARAYRAQAMRDLFQSVVGWFRRRAAIAQLQRMDDRTLKDIGLRRGEIEAAVCGGHRSRQPFASPTSGVPACGARSNAGR
jgi:uncharacterized protein YjiS (DUF1127 family)